MIGRGLVPPAFAIAMSAAPLMPDCAKVMDVPSGEKEGRRMSLWRWGAMSCVSPVPSSRIVYRTVGAVEDDRLAVWRPRGRTSLVAVRAIFDKPVLHDLHVGIGHVVTSWATLGLVGFGFVAFLIQQLSLATGRLAPAMAAVSVSNPAVSVVLGILLYQEKLTRAMWHVFVAVVALLAALAGAAIITLANRETQMADAVAADDRARPDPAPA
jgi:hypothetical protein